MFSFKPVELGHCDQEVRRTDCLAFLDPVELCAGVVEIAFL